MKKLKKLKTLLKQFNNPSFLFLAGRIKFNDYSVAVYHLNNEEYLLVCEYDSVNTMYIEVHGYTTMSIDDYENLPHDPYHSLTRFFAAAARCGVYFNDN